MADNPHREGGFTLVELLTVIMVIGILAAIVLPFFGHRSKAQRATLTADLRNVSSAQEAFFVENGAYAADEADLALEGFRRSAQIGDLSIAVYGVGDVPAYCVVAEHASSGDRAWMSSTSGTVSRTNPDPVSCPA